VIAARWTIRKGLDGFMVVAIRSATSASRSAGDENRRSFAMPKKSVPHARTATGAADPTTQSLRASHLRREVKTALELALAALVRSELIDQLAIAAGLLEALAEFPQGSPPVLATLPRAIESAERALDGWRTWEASARKASA
jgi:hypothetical protein